MLSTFETCAEEIQAKNDLVFLVTENTENAGFADVGQRRWKILYAGMLLLVHAS